MASSPVSNAAVTVNPTTTVKATVPVERKKIAQPGLKIVTKNVGIKSILDPPKNAQMENENALLPDLAENFTHSELMAVWKNYAMNLQREKKTSLATTLMSSEPIVSSDFQITLEIANSSQASDLEIEKSTLLGHLRSKLRNYQIGFNYKVSEKKQALSTSDTKATFEKLAEDNPSLHKFRKLFNLDIDF
ncbi:MAG: hypothetical protein HYZ14_13020 [Bacteroidetes bacterium]|nr:hypothetical protein [Bacteroidota bacterium]